MSRSAEPRGPRSRAAYRWLFRTLAALGLLWLLTVITPLTAWWSAKLAGPWAEPTEGVLIIPGADIQAPGVIGYSSYLRCRYAAMAWQTGHFEHVLITGGGDGTGPAVSALMRDLLTSWRIPAERITVEERSISTRENALFSAPLLRAWPGRPKVLLTSDQHMFRAIRVFRRAGVHCSPRSFPDAGKRSTSWTQRPAVLAGLLEETAKIIYYWWRGWL